MQVSGWVLVKDFVVAVVEGEDVEGLGRVQCESHKPGFKKQIRSKMSPSPSRVN